MPKLKQTLPAKDSTQDRHPNRSSAPTAARQTNKSTGRAGKTTPRSKKPPAATTAASAAPARKSSLSIQKPPEPKVVSSAHQAQEPPKRKKSVRISAPEHPPLRTGTNRQSSAIPKHRSLQPPPSARRSSLRSSTVAAIAPAPTTAKAAAPQGASSVRDTPSPSSNHSERSEADSDYDFGCRCGLVGDGKLLLQDSEGEALVQCDDCHRWSHIACQRDGMAADAAAEDTRFECDQCSGEVGLIGRLLNNVTHSTDRYCAHII